MRFALFGLACLGLTLTLDAQTPSFIDNNSCATATCHGGLIGQGPAWNHSSSTWYAKDPHAGAGALLRDADSRAIVELLDENAKSDKVAYDNVLRTRCISCHATPTPEQCTEAGELTDEFLNEGVSCQACHGAASEWLDPHIKTDWAGAPANGMLDTKSIIGRANNCTRCHIGSRSENGLVRDMNHDLIAAGHPALRFDLLLYNANLPKHWDLDSEVEREFNASPVRTRMTGRAVNFSAALKLSSERAAGHLADPKVPWPELADYDCFACHQALTIRRFALPSARRDSPLHVSDGLPFWNAWHAVRQQGLTPEQLRSLAPNQVDPNVVASSAPKLSQMYAEKANGYVSGTVDAAEFLKRSLDQLRERPPYDWHEASILYLEIDAALRELGDTQRLQGLAPAERRLRFDPGKPEGQRARIHSPGRFDPEAFRKAILDLFP